MTSFWAEWWAGALGLAAAVTLLAGRARDVPLPALLGLPGVLLLALLLQFVLGRVTFPQVGLLYAVYLLWAGLLLILGRHLTETMGLARLATVLASAFALGALLGAGVALAQWLGLADRMPWVFPHQGAGIFANLGQPNHHAHYSWLGIASLFYLRGCGKLSRPLFWLTLLPIVLASVVSGSRSVLVYPVVLLLAIVWARRRQPQGPAASLLVSAAILLPLVIALSYLSHLDFAASSNPVATTSTPLSRLYTEVSGSSIRLGILRTTWSTFAARPWLGQGAGNYSWASFSAAASRTGDEQFLVAEHAHNIVMQGLADFGAPAVIAALLFLGLWATRFLRQTWQLEHVWCGTVLGIGAVHSLLEYPLWYSYFLGPTALLLGATDSGKTLVLTGPRVRLYLALVALAGAVILGNLRADYSKIEAASNYPLAAHRDRETAWRMSMDRLLVLHRESLLSPWVLLAFTNLSQPSRQLAEERADLCQRGIRFTPARALVTRCAMQLALAGRTGEAEKLTAAVLRAFPAERAATVDELAQGARNNPELAPLWQLSRDN